MGCGSSKGTGVATGIAPSIIRSNLIVPSNRAIEIEDDQPLVSCKNPPDVFLETAEDIENCEVLTSSNIEPTIDDSQSSFEPTSPDHRLDAISFNADASSVMDSQELIRKTTKLQEEFTDENENFWKNEQVTDTRLSLDQSQATPQIVATMEDESSPTALQKPAVFIEDEFTEIYRNLGDVIHECRSTHDVKSRELAKQLELLEKFKLLAGDRKDELKKHWIQKLYKLGFVSYWLQTWPEFWEHEFLDSNDEEIVLIRINFTYMLRLLWSTTDCSHRICEKFCKLYGLALILDRLRDTSIFTLQTIDSNPKKRYIVSGLLSIINNCLRMNPNAVNYFRQANGIKTVAEFCKCEQMLIRTKTIICLSYAMTQEDSASVSISSGNIKYMISLLNSAVDEPTHRYHGFTAQELTDALNHLAVSDTNKVKLVKCGLLPILVGIMKQTRTQHETYTAVKSLWSLSFAHYNKEKMKKEPDCIGVLEQLKTHKNGSIAKAANGALWLVCGALVKMRRHSNVPVKLEDTDDTIDSMHRSVSSQELNEDINIEVPVRKNTLTVRTEEAAQIANVLQKHNEGGHIMISYDWLHKSVATKLKYGLNRYGYSTWMDIDQMSGSTLEAMAESIEDACVVIICMSERYRNSPACRTEAEYTFSLRKPIIPLRVEAHYVPDSWLGALVGSKLFFDCFNEEEVEIILPKLVKELGDRGRMKDHDSDGASIVSHVPRKNSVSATQMKKEKIQAWSQQDVACWLQDNSMQVLVDALTDFDGTRLLGLRNMYERAPASFYQMSKDEMKLKLCDLVHFAEMLENLLI